MSPPDFEAQAETEKLRADLACVTRVLDAREEQWAAFSHGYERLSFAARHLLARGWEPTVTIRNLCAAEAEAEEALRFAVAGDENSIDASVNRRVTQAYLAGKAAGAEAMKAKAVGVTPDDVRRVLREGLAIGLERKWNAMSLEERATEVKRAAELRIRVAFHRKWGSYWKCDKCGGRISDAVLDAHAFAMRDDGPGCKQIDSPCCGKPVVRNGYSAPSEVVAASQAKRIG